MGTRDPRVTAYIDGRAPFAKPVLRQLRSRIHAGARGLEETLKWGMPAFLHRGKIVCGFAGFKQHCALWFWHGREVVGERASSAKQEAMGQFGRITTVDELPAPALLETFLRKRIEQIEKSEAGRKTR